MAARRAHPVPPRRAPCRRRRSRANPPPSTSSPRLPPTSSAARRSSPRCGRRRAPAGRSLSSACAAWAACGKTALALKLAGELAPRYPDGQIFLDLQGVSTGAAAAAPLSPAQAMAHVIRSFLPEARVPEGAAELAGLYRSVLHGRRVLLLMDNAARKEQVEPLMPPPITACSW